MRTPMSCCFLRFFGSGQQDCVRAWVVGCGRQGAGGVLHRGRFGEGGTLASIATSARIGAPVPDMLPASELKTRAFVSPWLDKVGRWNEVDCKKCLARGTFRS